MLGAIGFRSLRLANAVNGDSIGLGLGPRRIWCQRWYSIYPDSNLCLFPHGRGGHLPRAQAVWSRRDRNRMPEKLRAIIGGCLEACCRCLRNSKGRAAVSTIRKRTGIGSAVTLDYLATSGWRRDQGVALSLGRMSRFPSWRLRYRSGRRSRSMG
jgi:hypothetical protein